MNHWFLTLIKEKTMANLKTFLDGKNETNPPREVFLVKDFIHESSFGRINLAPKAYQRNFHADKAWQQQFLVSFFVEGIVIPEIALRIGMLIPEGWDSEVMDGCQRVSTILAFINGDVDLPETGEASEALKAIMFEGSEMTEDLRGLSYKRLPLIAKEHFGNQGLGAMLYYNIDSLRAGFLFTDVLNNTNTLNPQEKRQAIASAMSIQIQNWTRYDDIHPMFELKSNGDLKYIRGATHSRLDVDKTLAELVYMLQNTRNQDFVKTGTTGKVITDFYKDQAKNNTEKFDNVNFVKKVLGLVNQGVRGVKTGKEMGLKQWRNYAYLVGEITANMNKIDPLEFLRVYMKAIDNLKAVAPMDGLTGSPYELRMRGNGGEDTKVAISLIRDEMNVIGFAKVLLDNERVFTRDQVRIAFDEQNGMCAICNEEMPEFNEDVHGDHILLYKDGHPTTQENCAAVHSTCNWRK